MRARERLVGLLKLPRRLAKVLSRRGQASTRAVASSGEGACGEHDSSPLDRAKASSEALRRALSASLDSNGAELHMLAPLSLLRRATDALGVSIEGELLEVGSYGHPGLAFALLMLGAERLHLDNVSVVENLIPRTYAENLVVLFNAFAIPLRRSMDEVLIRADDNLVRVDPSLVVVHSQVDAANLALEPGSLRGVFSLAVLEHVRDPWALLAKTHTLLEPGGWFFHAVDLRDHRSFGAPLRFLELSEEEYRREDPGGNRWRGPDYVRALEELKFEVVSVEYARPFAVNECGTTDMYELLLEPLARQFVPITDLSVWVDEAARSRLQPEFQRFSLEELSGTGVNLTGRKPRSSS